MGFSLDISVPVLTVFVQGLVSFFSPCVLPLIPLYIGYLSGGTGTKGEDGRIHYRKSKVMLNTFFFVVGVSFAFFLLGLGVSAVGTFFKTNQLLFARIGGILIALFGIYQLGLLGTSQVLSKERRLPFRFNRLAMSPITALMMGFTFSFAWTPCVGPALASVLLMAASAAAKTTGFVLIGVYTLGFVLPFLAVGLFTTSLLAFFKNHMNVVKYTVKIGGILMILMGVLMFTGKMNDVTGYLSKVSVSDNKEKEAKENKTSHDSENGSGDETGSAENASGDETDSGENGSGDETDSAENASGDETDSGENASAGSEETTGESDSTASELPPSVDFTLKDQYGEEHTLSDYKGKTVFLNFWATWCSPCRAEMPDIQKIYESYDREGDDALVVLGVAAPEFGQEQTSEGIASFLEENGYTYPTLMDTTGKVFTSYGISSFPTTFMIDKDGNVFGYASGQLNEDTMKSIIEQTMEGKRKNR